MGNEIGHLVKALTTKSDDLNPDSKRELTAAPADVLCIE